MAYAVRRPNGRFTGLYNVPGSTPKSVGTFDTREAALAAAEAKEVYVRAGSRGPDPQERLTKRVDEYCWEWLHRHPVEPVTKANYASILRTHVIPRFGAVRVSDLQREAIRGFLRELQERGLAVTTQRRVRAVLSAMLQTAWEDGYRTDNPVRGLRVPRGSRKRLKVLTVEQFRSVQSILPTPGAKLFALFLVSTGLRLGEATALTVSDLDFSTQSLRVSKSLQDVGREFHPNGIDRFRISPMTKSGYERTLRLNQSLVTSLSSWVTEHALTANDLLFPRDIVLPARPRRRKKVPLTPERVEQLGWFAGPNRRSYQHGTVNGYIVGKCRCDFCRQAASEYSLERRRIRNRQRSRGGSQDGPTPRVRYAQTAFLSRDRWSTVWKAACKGADMPFTPTAYQVRHTHASWLIDQGEDPKTVMTRLGHQDLRTTSLYVHDVGSDSSSADIMESLSRLIE